MSHLLRWLENPNGPKVIPADEPTLANAIEIAARLKYRVYRLECADARSADDLFAIMKSAFDFPDYFGANWDAVIDCLRDLPDANGYMIVCTGIDAFSRRDRVSTQTLIDILDISGREWALSRQNTVCKTIIRTNDDRIADCIRLYASRPDA
jgi:RNAse (barnase) inhibitor barstar